MQNIISICGTIFLISFLSEANLVTPDSHPFFSPSPPDTAITAGNAVPLTPRRPASADCIRTDTMRGLKGFATMRNPTAGATVATATIIKQNKVRETMVQK